MPKEYVICKEHKHITIFIVYMAYTYSFGLLPDNYQPSNTINFSRYDDTTIQFDPQIYETHTETQKIIIGGHDIKNVANEECPVCMEIKNDLIQLNCKHIFCENCLTLIAINKQIKCPLCRHEHEFDIQYKIKQTQKEENGIYRMPINYDYKNILHIINGSAGLRYIN